VQSNGVAEWLKIALAEELGVCAATRVALPARFLWEAYRGMLGPERVPRRSPFDKDALTWRLMRLLPALLQKDPVFAPLRHFLGDGDPERRLQLAERLADLYDQYQVYRADWLTDWAEGRDQLRRPGGEPVPLAPTSAGRPSSGASPRQPAARAPLVGPRHHPPAIHGRGRGRPPPGSACRAAWCCSACRPCRTRPCRRWPAVAPHPGAAGGAEPLPVLLGRHHRGPRAAARRLPRQQQREGRDLAAIPVEELHAHSHPLLASWGRQGRDFVRMLDEFDGGQGAAASATCASTCSATGDGRDLAGPGAGGGPRPAAAVRASARAAAAGDRSIEFHIAHSAQREVEVLHDQLLSWFAKRRTARCGRATWW
jgi:exodeoxyribonuclease V gamma subunit